MPRLSGVGARIDDRGIAGFEAGPLDTFTASTFSGRGGIERMSTRNLPASLLQV
jgi:hypothetical protein